MAQPISDALKKKFIHIPEDTYKFFSSIPWANQFLNDPAYEPVTTYLRVVKSGREGHFFANTLNTPATIPHIIYLRRKDLRPPDATATGIEIRKFSANEPYAVPELPDTIHLLHLGELGLDGHIGISHGGAACAILDETMGQCASLNVTMHYGSPQSIFTANLDINFRRPVVTNSEVWVRCWIGARQGSRWYTYGQIMDKDGTILTEAQGVWVRIGTEQRL